MPGAIVSTARRTSSPALRALSPVAKEVRGLGYRRVRTSPRMACGLPLGERKQTELRLEADNAPQCLV